MKEITSLSNPEVKKVVALHDKKGRRAQHLFIVEGVRSVQSFISAQWQPSGVFISYEFYQQLPSWLASADITLVSDVVMKKMSTSKTPSGLLALFTIPSAPPAAELRPGLVLAEISDAGNMGTLIRSAAAFAIPSLVIVDGCDPWSPKVIQSAAGAHALLSLMELRWSDVVRLKKEVLLCGLVVLDGKDPDEVDLCNALLVVGSEAHGIPHEWLKDCDDVISLPMSGHTESLNAAVAGSIALYLQYQACIVKVNAS